MELERVSRGLRMAVVLVLLGAPASAQVLGEMRVAETCSYFGENLPDNVSLFASNNEAEEAIGDIVGASGLAKNFDVRAAAVPNAAAVIYDSIRYILYNTTYMHDIRNQTGGNPWSAISIMAHEVGHHLNGHTLDQKGSRPIIELEADYFSGFALQKLGASLADAQIALRTLGSNSASATHPAGRDRLEAVASGWTKACEADSDCGQEKTDRATPNDSGEKSLDSRLKSLDDF